MEEGVRRWLLLGALLHSSSYLDDTVIKELLETLSHASLSLSAKAEKVSLLMQRAPSTET